MAILTAGEHAGLGKTEEEASREDAGIVGRDALETGNEAECKHAKGDCSEMLVSQTRPLFTRGN